MPVTRRSAAPATAGGDVFTLIRDGAATTRTEIRELTGLSRTAVGSRIAALGRRGLVSEGEEGPSTGGGRPPALVRFNAEAGVVLSAAIGRSRTRLAVCNLAGDIQALADMDSEIRIGPMT